MNPFTRQGKALPNNVREKIVDDWLQGKGPTEIGKELKLDKQTVSSIVDNFVRKGHVEAGKGGNKIRSARTDDVIYYAEYCKQTQPSNYGSEIQRRMVENNVCLAQNVPSRSAISRILTQDLGYSFKKVSAIPQESLTPDAEARLIQYLTVCAGIDPTTMHFFDECSVVKTSGKRHYGNSPVGQPALEVQRYASNATFTVNLLHNMYGVGHVNLLPGPSNGLELLNFFAEALQEEDLFGNPLLKDGDTVIMDNCGFHHARHVEPVLRNMLAIRRVSLIYQPPYHPQYNTCELCFRHLKGWLRKHSQFAQSHTDIAIFHGLSTITAGISKNFFKLCGYIYE